MVALPDADGNTQDYQIIAVVEYNGRRYAALVLLDAFTDATSLDLPIELREFELTEQDGVQGAVFSTIESEQEYESVADIVAQKIEEMNRTGANYDGLPS